MRYPAPEKLEIIRIVEQSHLPTKITLDKHYSTRISPRVDLGTTTEKDFL